MALIDLTAVQSTAKEFIAPLHTFSPVITIASSSGNAAGADIAVDVSYVTNTDGTDQWILGIGLFNALTQAKVNSITGVSQLAWTDIPGAKKVRVRRTDATAGVCLVDVEICNA